MNCDSEGELRFQEVGYELSSTVHDRGIGVSSRRPRKARDRARKDEALGEVHVSTQERIRQQSVSR